MPWHTSVIDNRIYVIDKDGGRTPAGGYPNTPEGRAQARKYIEALYANAGPEADRD